MAQLMAPVAAAEEERGVLHPLATVALVGLMVPEVVAEVIMRYLPELAALVAKGLSLLFIPHKDVLR